MSLPFDSGPAGSPGSLRLRSRSSLPDHAAVPVQPHELTEELCQRQRSTLDSPIAAQGTVFIAVVRGEAPRESTALVAPDPNPVPVRTHFGHAHFPSQGLSVYRASTPRNCDFPQQWGNAMRGAPGMVVLADADSFDACELARSYCEQDGLPFVYEVMAPAAEVVAEGGPQAWGCRVLETPRDVPAVLCDDRRDSAVAALRRLTVHARSHEMMD